MSGVERIPRSVIEAARKAMVENTHFEWCVDPLTGKLMMALCCGPATKMEHDPILALMGFKSEEV